MKTHECAEKHPPIVKTDASGVLKRVEESKKPFVLVSFYATSCKPCIREIPDLLEIKNSGNLNVDLLMVSVDNKEVVDKYLAGFLHERDVQFSTYYAGGTDAETNKLVHTLVPSWEGTIPLNILMNNKGEVLKVLVGRTTAKEIRHLTRR